MKRIYLPYREAEKHIKDADILLFRPPVREKWWHLPSIGYLIAKYTGGEHCHVGIAKVEKDGIELLEFREWYGGRSTFLLNQFPEKSGLIDIYRPVPKITTIKSEVVEKDGTFLVKTILEEKKFTQETADKIIREMCHLTGLPYGWDIIFKLGKAYLPGIRLFSDKNKFDNDVEENIYVCSSAVNYVFRKHYVDPVPGIADSYTKPSDLAESTIFNYQFTIT